jgi:TonB family protein
MRSGCALFVWLFVWSTAATALQSALPAQENLLVVGARAMRQPNTQTPLQLTLMSGKRITMSPQDVHELATILVRRAMMGQAYRAVDPSLLFVLHIRQLTPVSKSDVEVTFSSGTVIRVRSRDVSDVRLTFLHTVLAKARSGVASGGSAQSAGVQSRESGIQPGEQHQPPVAAGMQFDAKGVDFGPWIRRFITQMRRNWLVPFAAMTNKGQVVVSFSVRKDGSVINVSVKEPSALEAFNESARQAILKSSPTEPLPADYPDESAFFTVTFYFNESPPQWK